MNTFLMNEASFEVPEDWRDQTINIFAVGSEPPLSLSFVISRGTLRDGEELVDHVERELGQFGEKLKQFRLIGKRQVEVGGGVALEAEFTWKSDKGPMHQRQQYVRRGARIIIFTATAPVKIADEHIEQLNSLLASVQFRV
jgi:hypothetical protein